MTDHDIRAKAAWHQDFFEGLMAEFWLEAVSDAQSEDEADFLVRELEMAPGGQFLDVACGAGRHAVALGRRGFACHGIDGSKLLTQRALDLSSGLPVTIERCDVRGWRAPRRFDGAWLLGNGFGYFDHDENARLLRMVGEALAPGARFVIETGAVAECVLPGFEEEERSFDAGRYRLSARRRYDVAGGYMHTRYMVTRGERSEAAMARQAVYTVHRLLEMCAAAGFTPCALYADFERTSFAVGAGRLVAVFEREA